MIRSIRRYPLASFFVLAYGLTWLYAWPKAVIAGWPDWLAFLAVFGPALAALLVAAALNGLAGAQQLLASLATWRVRPAWYLIVLLGPLVMVVASVLLYRLLGRGSGMQASFDLLHLPGDHLLALAAIFFYQLLILWGEELGWRGFALPRLQARFHPLVASLVLGILWGFWHLPLFWTPGTVQQGMSLPYFMLASIGYSVLYTWVYNGTGGSVLLVCLLHAANNTTVTYSMLFFKPLLTEPAFSLFVLACFDLLVILLAGPRLQLRTPAAHVQDRLHLEDAIDAG